jgi:hypothetical protein
VRERDALQCGGLADAAGNVGRRTAVGAGVVAAAIGIVRVAAIDLAAAANEEEDDEPHEEMIGGNRRGINCQCTSRFPARAPVVDSVAAIRLLLA